MTIGLHYRPFWARHGVEVLYGGAPGGNSESDSDFSTARPAPSP
jgi:hypothetical protein